MTIADLLEKREKGIFKDDKVLKCDLIALDAKDGKILFDTSRNKSELINGYSNGEVLSLWADCKLHRGIYGDSFVPIMKCYVSHNSWERG